MRLIEAGAIKDDQLEHAAEIVGVYPDSSAWRTFMDKTLLYTGSAAITLSLLFFIAYNWANFGRFGKFALVQTFMIAAIVAYVKFGNKRTHAQATLTAAIISIGVLLALFGQTYQTGADPWQLFALWAVLMLPWALIANSAAIWLIWVVLLNITFLLHQMVFANFWWFGSAPVTFTIFALNSFALIAWEILRKRCQFLDRDWAIWPLAVTTGVAITWMVVDAALRSRVLATPLLWWIGWLAIIYPYYRLVRKDVFVLAVGCLSGIVGITVIAAKGLFKSVDDIASFLVLTVLVVILGSVAAAWLRSVYQELNSQ